MILLSFLCIVASSTYAQVQWEIANFSGCDLKCQPVMRLANCSGTLLTVTTASAPNGQTTTLTYSVPTGYIVCGINLVQTPPPAGAVVVFVPWAQYSLQQATLCNNMITMDIESSRGESIKIDVP